MNLEIFIFFFSLLVIGNFQNHLKKLIHFFFFGEILLLKKSLRCWVKSSHMWNMYQPSKVMVNRRICQCNRVYSSYTIILFIK
jgi:hypothetical protein